ncbi:hypothetical protein [Brevundimonas bullata]|uniref:hypothetical protein n=1 Tax=Brevundimonas bullata TaxID=13160 RepID=UPI003D9A18EE
MKQFGLRSHDTNFFVGDLDALGEGAQVIPPIAASFDAHLVARGAGERIDHVGRDGVAAGVFQRRPRAIRIGGGLIPKRFQIGDPILEPCIVQIGHT